MSFTSKNSDQKAMNLDFQQFCELAKTYNVIPLYESLPADVDTPVSALMKLKTGEYDFLFESVVGGEKWARYSFLGTNPLKTFVVVDGHFVETDVSTGEELQKSLCENPLHHLREVFKDFCAYQDPDLPRFFGGVVGTLGYDVVADFENIPLPQKSNQQVPAVCLMLTDSVVIFDNLKQLMRVVNTVHIPGEVSQKQLQTLYAKAQQKILGVKERLKTPLSQTLETKATVGAKQTASMTKEAYCQAVQKAKEYIAAGDVFQVVLSLKFEVAVEHVDALSVYRGLRRINPSPYLYYLQLGEHAVVGASPEVLVRVEEGQVMVRPIAGTRPRGQNESEDLRLEAELRADPKERAEHIMLVDLGRNDVGRVAKIGSVVVDETEVVERYSHVMHLVSQVSGELASDKDVFDAIEATFPAGTLSGAPKIRAMQIISELEGTRRGVYGGAVGYISFTHNADLAIAIRTAVLSKGAVTVQAGAGIVYNSVPASEYQECCHKAKAMLKAIQEGDGL